MVAGGGSRAWSNARDSRSFSAEVEFVMGDPVP